MAHQSPMIVVRMRGLRLFRATTWVVAKLPMPRRLRLAILNMAIRRLAVKAGRGKWQRLNARILWWGKP